MEGCREKACKSRIKALKCFYEGEEGDGDEDGGVGRRGSGRERGRDDSNGEVG